ncbi:MAG: histidine kinase [Prevotella sp.]|uniref:sensor histidine kinase n=1 Tax=Prevotella sp. TaxID=59823 RepID=UPI002A264E62|nr:histidine kinase [Prevotella sp.]MDD7318956.1 histidine kinase [Prevotellaceae bacterium]MDY4019982.1 histidine kinase [Prevotella sp.]
MKNRRTVCNSMLTSTIIIVATYIVFQAFYNLIAFKSLFPYQDIYDFKISVASNLVPVIVLFVFNFTFVFRINRLRNIIYKILADVTISYLFLVVLNFVFILIMRKPDPSSIDWAGTMFCNTFILMGMEMSFYIRHYQSSLRQAEEYKRRVLMYQYNALKAQVNPHFLFNSLNILYSLIAIDQKKSRHFVMSLSDMYRYIMTQQDKERVPLEDELGFLASYVEVLKMRYYNQFDVKIEGAELVKDQEIIPYTLQLLMENVTKHNVISQRFPLEVSIKITENDIRVSNHIRTRQSASSSGIGLRYITELYQQNGKDFVYTNDGNTFEAVVPYLDKEKRTEHLPKPL